MRSHSRSLRFWIRLSSVSLILGASLTTACSNDAASGVFGPGGVGGLLNGGLGRLFTGPADSQTHS